MNTVNNLLKFHGIYTQFNFKALFKKLDAADRARNILTHSLYMRDKTTGKITIQIVHGSWEFDQDVIQVSRALQPETKEVTRDFLKEKRADVEGAIKAILPLHRLVGHALATLNEKRRTQSGWDRRHQPQSK